MESVEIAISGNPHRFTLTSPELQLIGEVYDGLEAVEISKQLHPDLILLDIGLPKMNGIEAAQQIRQASPTSKILFVSENRSGDIVEKALNTGANGYVLKSDAGSDLLLAIKTVLEGKRFVSTSLSDHGFRGPSLDLHRSEHKFENNSPKLK